MSITFAQFKAGIKKIESGGRYSVVNSIGAVGAYQVMKANIPSWTKRALGHSMTWQQFRDSPSAQEKVADVILGGYYKKYGAEGAAAMWFSGQPNPNSGSSDGGNTVRQYVNKVMAAAGAAPSGGSGGGGGVTPQLSQDELASQYGLTSALINSSSELKKLFKQAVSGSWSADLFQAHLKNTKWWSTQSDTLRQYLTEKYTDPATWKQKNDNELASVKAMAVQVGLIAGHWTGNLNKMVYNSLALGWSDDRIKSYLGSLIGTGGTEHPGGQAGADYDQIQQLLYDNGVTQDGKWILGQVRNIESDRSTVEAVEAGIRKQAAAKYSAFSQQILAGQNALDLASPYIQSVSKLLEVPDTSIGLSNSHVLKAMTSNSAGQAQSIWDFENSLRQDPLWRKTQNAQDSIMGTAHQVLQQFGVTF